MDTENNRAEPTGFCWCGCGAKCPEDIFFRPGHDKVAESAVILVEYGGVPEFLEKHGFGPSGRNARAELAEWRARGGTPR